MAVAEFTKILDVDSESFRQAVLSFDKYPEFLSEIKSVEVEKKGQGAFRVSYKLSIMMKEINYTLDHKDEEDGRISWSLVTGDFFSINNGFWRIIPAEGKKTEATYSIEIDFKVPVPKMIIGRLIKGNLPKMFKEFEAYARLLTSR